jgi:3-hydroxyacyl-CoA dehydrogenase
MTRPAPHEVSRAAIIGTGLIGAAWASLFLARGLEVLAIDPAPNAAERLRQTVSAMAPALRDIGITSCKADFDRLTVVGKAGAELEGIDFVQENVPENLALKRSVLSEIEAWIDPETIIASSTSALRISDIQAGARHPERCIAGHPINPPHLMPLVEVSGGEATDPALVDWAISFYAWLGKKPVRLNRDIEGHIAGRLSAALWREAVSLVEQGIVSVADIDAAVRYGPGLRWATMGPHLTYHLGGGEGGIRHYLAHLGPSQQKRWAALGTPTLTDELKERIAEGVIEEAGGRSISDLAEERDRLLAVAIKSFVD